MYCQKQTKKGFTLVELVVVIAVIAILSVVLIPTLVNVISSAKLSQDQSTASQMTLVLQTNYPEGLAEQAQAPDIRTYITEQGTNYSFVPSNAKNYSFWYNISNNSVELLNGQDLALKVNLSQTNMSSLEELFKGYILLDKGGSSLGEIVTQIRNANSLPQYSAAIQILNALTTEQTGLTQNQIDFVINYITQNYSFETTLFVNDFSYVTGADAYVKNVLFCDGLKYLPDYDGDIVAVENAISLPRTLQFISNETFLKDINQLVINEGLETEKTIETNMFLINSAENIILTNAPSQVFSAYLLNKMPILSTLQTNGRQNPIANVTFKTIINSDQLKTNDDGSKEMPISIEAQIPVFYDAEVCTDDEDCYVLIETPTTMISKSDYELLSSNEQALYTLRTINRDNILAMRFQYQSIDDGSIFVRVRVLDNLGLLCEGSTTYFPNVKITTFSFSNGNLIFNAPKLPQSDIDNVSYKVEVLNDDGQVVQNGTFDFDNSVQNGASSVIEYQICDDIGNMEFMSKIVSENGYVWYNSDGTLLTGEPIETSYVYRLTQTEKVVGNVTTTKKVNSKIFAENGVLYEEYYQTELATTQRSLNGIITVSNTETHKTFYRTLNAVSTPNNFIITETSNGVPYSTIKVRVSTYYDDILMNQKTSVFGSLSNPITSIYVDELTDSSQMAAYLYGYSFVDPLYYETISSTEQLVFTDKQIYSYEQVDDTTYTFKVKGTGTYNGKGITIGQLDESGSVKSKEYYDARYRVEYNLYDNRVVINITGLDSLFSLDTDSLIEDAFTFKNRVTYTYVSARSQLNLEQNVTLTKVNGKTPVQTATDTYSVSLSAGENFNPLATTLHFDDGKNVNATAFEYDVVTGENSKTITIQVGEKTITILCSVESIGVTYGFVNETITSSITVRTDSDRVINNLENGVEIDYAYDQEITLIAGEVDSRYKFIGWFENGEFLSALSIFKYTMGNTSVNLTAEYATNYTNLLVFQTNSSTVTATLTWCYDKSLTEIYIPSYYDIFKVTQVGDGVFQNCVNLATVIVPKTVDTIGSLTFKNTPFLSNAVDGIVTFGNYLYKYIEPTTSAPTSLTIPEGITSIMSYAFQNNSKLESITLPSTLTIINSYAFDNCESLIEINIPDGLLTISNNAFQNCHELEEIDLKNITTLGSNAFLNCASLSNVILSQALTTLSSSIFSGCVSLSSITLHEGITSLGSSLFSNCSALTEIAIPQSVTSINVSSVFSNCTSLSMVTFAEGNDYTEVGPSFFYNCSVLTDINNLDLTLVTFFGSNAFNGCSAYDFGDLILGTVGGESVSLSSGTFANCYLLKTVTFKSNLEGTVLYSSLFSGCLGLDNVSFMGSITQIQNSAFNNCNALKNISGINFRSVDYVGASTFYNCLNLELNDIVIGNASYDYIFIGTYAFYNCDKLTGVILNGKDITSATAVNHTLGNYSFYECSNLVYITLPYNTTTIGTGALRSCLKLEHVSKSYNEPMVQNQIESQNLNLIMEDGLRYTREFMETTNVLVAEQSVSNDMLVKNQTLIAYLGTQKIVTIPETVSIVGDYAFWNNQYIEEIIIPADVTQILDNAFYGCVNLKKITFQATSTLNLIDENAFNNCDSLVSVTLPNSLTNIGANAFNNCDELIAIYLTDGTSATPATIGVNTFGVGTSIFVDEVYVDTYKESWSSYAENINIDDDANQNPEGSSEEFEIVSGTLYKYNGTQSSVIIPSTVNKIESLAFKGNETITSVVIPSSVTEMGDGIFQNCSRLTTVTFNNQMTSITNNLFYNCVSLTTLTGTGFNFVNITSIGNYAFYNCQALNIVNFTIHATTLGTNVFQNCRSLTNVTITNNLSNSELPALTFSGCLNLVSVTLNSNINSLKASAFAGCSKLATIQGINISSISKFGSGVFSGCSSLNFTSGILTLGTITEMGNGVFANCSSLTTLNLTNSTFPSNTISSNTFQGCSSVTAVNFPSNLQIINSGAFKGLNSLTNITIPSNVTTIGNNAFENCSNLISIDLNNVSTLGAYTFLNCMNLETVVLPSSLTTLSDETFRGCISLDTINLNYITSFGKYIFKDDTSLTTATLSSSLVTIGTYAFADWNSLESITIPTSVTRINSHAFENCKSLTGINLNNATILEGYLFNGCVSLTSITMPSGLSTITSFLFMGANNLTTINCDFSTVNVIQEKAFYNCKSLTTLEGLNFENLTNIGDYAFYNCYNLNFGDLTLSKESSILTIGAYAFVNCKLLTSVLFACDTLKYSTTSDYIASYMFQNCVGLTNVTLPASITRYGAGVFQNCINLTTINNLDLTKAIYFNSNVFYNCQNLEFNDTELSPLIISKSGINLVFNSAVFYNCKQLEYVKFESDAICYSSTTSDYQNYLYSSAFYGCSNLIKVILPTANDIENIGSSVFANCTNLVTIENLDFTKLKVLGSSAFYNCFNINYNGTNSISLGTSGQILSVGSYAFYNNKSLREVVLNATTSYTSSGETREDIIAYAMFYGCANLNEFTDNSSNKIRFIDSYAFYDCQKLQTVLIDMQQVVLINSYAFYNCKKLDFAGGLVLNLLDGFGTYVFYSCESLTEVTINSLPESSKFIPAYTFMYCYNLQEVNLTNDIIKFNTQAFYGCANLQQINMPSNLQIIENSVFNGCESLSQVVLPNSVLSIGIYAFRFCSSLKEVVLPNNESFTKIPSYAFYGCVSLATIAIPDNVTTIDSYSFYYCVSLTTFIMESPVVNTILSSASFNYKNAYIVVPDSAVDLYKISSAGWSNFANQINASSEFTYNGDLVFKGSTLIKYSGEANEIIITPTTITIKKTGEVDVVVNVNTESIRAFAFTNIQSLQTITIHESVAYSINSFFLCSNLTNIYEITE